MESFWPNLEFHCLHKNLLKTFAFKVLSWTTLRPLLKYLISSNIFILETFYTPTNHFLEARCLLKFLLVFGTCWASLVGLMVKNLPAMQETWV